MTPGRLVLPALRWDAGSGIDRVVAEAEAALAHGVGGFILFGGAAEEVRELTVEIEHRAARPLLFAADLERGAGQQIRGLSEAPPPLALASLDDPEAIREAAARTAAEARSVGINWVLAPVADLDAIPDNPIVQTRSFGASPEAVARRVATWVEACQGHGCLAAAKHYPGHGATLHDSHQVAPVVAAGATSLAAADEIPFRAAIDAGVAAVMTAHIRYPALDPAGTIATYSRPILDRLRALGFQGLIVSDAMIMAGAKTGAGTSASGAAAAVAAGVDLVLYPEDLSTAVAGLSAAVAAGGFPPDRIEASVHRYERALRWIADRPAPQTDLAAGKAVSAGVADRVLAGGLVRGSAPDLAAPLELLIVDDDAGGPYPAGPSDWVARALGPDVVAGADGGKTRILLVFAEPRGWKGRAGLGRGSRESIAAAGRVDMIVLFGHPRLADEFPAGVPILVGWHRQRLMQDAVARWLLARLR